MAHNAKFGPSAQTPEQRSWVLEQMLAIIPSLDKRVDAHARQTYERYISGELSWTEMRYVLDNGA